MNKFCKLPAVLAAFLASPLVWAGTPPVPPLVVQWSSPGSTPVPTLTTTVLLSLAILMGVLVFRSLKNRTIVLRGLAALAVGTSSLFAVFDVADLNADLPAVTADTASGSYTYGSSLTLQGCFINASGVPLQVEYTNFSSFQSACSANSGTVVYGCPTGSSGTAGQVTQNSIIPSDELEYELAWCERAISDARLKEAIVHVGFAQSGLPVYEYRYIGRPEVYRGVMAQDVMLHTPSAIHWRDDGFMAVNYAALGIRMERIR